MAQVVPSPPSPAQIAAQCRAAPLVFDDVRTDLCPALEQIICLRAETTRRTASLNVGGWKSSEDFFAWCDDPIRELRDVVARTVGIAPSKFVAWAMLNRAGSHHPRHQHRVAMITGVYYVAVGDEELSSPTIFEYPDGELEVDPRVGRLALFRGETWHRVPIYKGDLPRITVAFDVRR
jgi:hypothetical protein